MAAAFVGGAALGAAFGELLKAILKAKEKAVNFRSILDRMETTLNTIIPIIKELEQLNLVLDRRTEEAEKAMEHIIRGNYLVLESSRIRWYNCCWTRVSYADKLLRLEKSLELFFQIVVAAQTRRDVAEILVGVKDLRMIGFQGKMGCSSAVPEPPENTVGLEVALWELKREAFKEGVCSVVLSAPPGCGKTTLAKLFCHDQQVQEKFKDNIFFVIVSRKPTLEGIVRRIFQHKGYQLPDLPNDEHVAYHMEQFLKQIGKGPILLVLDDVWPESQSLLEKFKFRIPDYMILVTSRSTFPGFGSTYKLKPLRDEYAITLFRNSAFLPDQKSDIPPEDVINKIVKGCKGFPLALKVVGRSLCGQPEEIWKTREMELSSGGRIFEYSDLLGCLQKSLDALEKPILKECFMDLSSFPEDHRIPVTALIDMWAELYKLDEDGVSAVANLHELSSRNLVDLLVIRKDLNGCYNQHFVMQHDLLRELALHQSNSESIELIQRLIVEISSNDFPDWWVDRKHPRIGCRLLSISTDEKFSSRWCFVEAPEVEALVLNFRTKHYTFPWFMERMEKLKVLTATNYGFCSTEVSNFHLIGSLPNLKRLRLELVSISSSAFTSMKLKNLRTMTLVLCRIGEAFAPSPSIKLPDALPNLQEINIDYCNNLTELPVGFCQLNQLKKLSITNCHSLAALPQEIGELTNLEFLKLTSCIELAELPDTMRNLHNLSILDISECPELNNLPEHMGELQNLRKMYMMGCSKDCKLPLSILKLKGLEEVTCDEETAASWGHFVPILKNLRIKVLKEDVNLHWLQNSRY